jgi:predicted nucleotidyltransferase
MAGYFIDTKQVKCYFHYPFKNFFLLLNMRISEKEIESIKILAEKIFGVGTKILLFGSRTADNKRGGDIDLFITNNKKENLTLTAKINFLVELKLLIGEQKIDVVLDTESTRSKKQFYKSIQQHAIEL